MAASALYRDRTDAGRALVRKLADYAGCDDIIVLALSGNGVPVAVEVAEALKAPLDVFLVEALRLPGYEERVLGAVVSDGVRVLDQDAIRDLNIPAEMIERVGDQQAEELKRREQSYRGNRPEPDLGNQTVILVDDGLMTGTRLRAAVAAVRSRQPAQIVVAVPVTLPEICETFGDEVEDVVCAETSETLWSVADCYEEYTQLADAEVRELLERQAEPGAHDNDSYYGLR